MNPLKTYAKKFSCVENEGKMFITLLLYLDLLGKEVDYVFDKIKNLLINLVTIED